MTVHSLRRVALSLVLPISALGGCASLPSSGPTAHDIEVSARDAPAGRGFRIQELTPQIVAELERAAPPRPALARLSSAGRIDVIGPGDMLQVSVFEVGDGLFSGRSGAASALGSAAGEAPSAGAEALPPLTVGADGRVAVPYAGVLPAAGLTAAELAQRIEAALQRKSQAPQVVVSVRETVSGGAFVMGDVRKPGRVPLSMAGERVLDAIALAGGAANPPEDERVHLRRGSADAEARLADLSAGSADDVVLSPLDRLELVYSPRTITVFGAAGKVAEVPLQTPRVNLAEALARSGGPSDQQADPAAVFVFRYDDGPQGPVPSAYRLDLSKADGFFLAQRFTMRPRDVVYIANAGSLRPTKLLQVLNFFFQPFYTAKVVSQ